MFLEGNPYLLVITMIVSCLHSVFDFLAFKNGELYSSTAIRFLFNTLIGGSAAFFFFWIVYDLFIYPFSLFVRYPILEQK